MNGKHSRWKGLLAVAVGVTALSACSMATLGPARPIDPGETQVVVAPAAMRVGRGSKPYVGPQLELGGRVGLTDSVDLGARLWLPLPGYTFDSRIALRKAKNNHGLDLALQPGLSYLYVPGGSDNDAPLHIGTVSLPLLIGWNLGGGNQVTVTPKLVDLIAVDTSTYGQTAQLVTAGATVGFVWQVTRQFALVPEVGLGWLVLGSQAGFGTEFGVNGSAAQLSLGLLFGGHKEPAQTCVPTPEPVSPL